MIAGCFHEGSGLGDQLFRYITMRTLAEKKGYTWGMCNTFNFKGEDFLKIDKGFPLASPEENTNFKLWKEKDIRDANGIDIRSYDSEINFVEDDTIIDGSFEDDKYWRHNLDNINKWLAVEPLNVPDDLCVIGFRGGEYASQPELFLPKDYYDEAIGKIRVINPNMQFIIHTDDTDMAAKFFDYKIPVVANPKLSHSKNLNMGLNWRNMRYAKYAIIPNSAFFILPRILNHHEDPAAVTIAPRYWARRNTKTWARPACYYPEFQYV